MLRKVCFMPEEISTLKPAAVAGVYTGVWIDPKEELPGEGEMVLVILDDYSMCFGFWMDDSWEIGPPPWDYPVTGEEEVIYWTEYPSYPSRLCYPNQTLQLDIM